MTTLVDQVKQSNSNLKLKKVNEEKEEQLEPSFVRNLSRLSRQQTTLTQMTDDAEAPKNLIEDKKEQNSYKDFQSQKSVVTIKNAKVKN